MFDRDWYHTIEVAPGLWTPGKNFPPIALTRHILERCQVAGANCLDVGTMDGLISILLSRKGAKRIVACDRYDRRPQIEFVKQKLGIDFDYLSGLSLAQVRNVAPHLVGDPFDLIVFSGVLYHMYDPMTGLALIRSMARPGGLVLIETYAILSKPMIAYFNAFGNIENDFHNYWNLSVELLDYLLRYFRLKALDCAYFPVPNATAEDGGGVLRVCVACEAVTDGLADPGDSFMVVQGRDDNADFPVWPAEAGTSVSYSAANEGLIRRQSGAVNLYETIIRTDPIVLEESKIKLALDAVS